MGVVAATCNIIPTVPTCIHTYVHEYRGRIGTHTVLQRGGGVERYVQTYTCACNTGEGGGPKSPVLLNQCILY